MPSKIRTRAQAKRDRVALRRLKSTGLFKGKIDARKPPTPAAKRAIGRYADVLKGRAKVLKPKNPKSYKGTFRVVGDKVIVPRRKGQRVKVGKQGEIEVARKVGGKMRRGRFKRLAELATEDKVFLLPLRRGDGLTWMKFDTRGELDKFVFETSPKVGATYKNYANYILEMDAATYDEGGYYEDEGEDNVELERALELQLARRRRARNRNRRRK